MEAQDLIRMCERLFEFYRLTSTPNPNQYELWLEDLAYIPGRACRAIEKVIRDEHDNLPRNLPKAIRAAYTAMPKDASSRHYNPIEDPSYPINYLHTALGVFLKDGVDAANLYMETVQMPSNDRDRVRCKGQVIQGNAPRKLKAIIKQGTLAGMLPPPEDPRLARDRANNIRRARIESETAE
jgi:hypothetical protein